MKTIKVKYLKDIEKLRKDPNGDWIDLRSAEDVEMKKGDYKLIPLGISMELPEGYEGIIAQRSSTFKNYKMVLINGIGIIDHSYCGDGDEWKFGAFALDDTVIHKNDRIGQFRIIKSQGDIEFDVVNELGNKNRGGIGSTGKR